ncbi:unnamed protein product, partial [Brassica oleracea var. botrytis]
QCAFQNLFDYPDLHNEIFKTVSSLDRFQECRLEVVTQSANLVATEIALSKTRGRRYQSYVAHGGLRWLSSLIEAEAGTSRSTAQVCGVPRTSTDLDSMGSVLTSSFHCGNRFLFGTYWSPEK